MSEEQKRLLEKQLWGVDILMSGYYINTVRQYASNDVTKRWVSDRGNIESYTKGNWILIFVSYINTSCACTEVVYFSDKTDNLIN